MNAEDPLQRQLRELQARHQAGELDDAAYQAARAPLERALVDRLLATPAEVPAAPAPKVGARMWAVLGLGVLALAVGGYSVTGSPQLASVSGVPSVLAQASAPAGEAPVTDEQVEAVIEQMAQRMKERPDDPVGWALLARAYSAMGRMAEALPAYERALALNDKDAGLMADYADALATQKEGRFSPAALQWVERALALEPDNLKALALSGSAAYDQRDYALAVRQWERVAARLQPGTEMFTQVRASIDKARELGGLPPSATVAAAPAAQAASPTGASKAAAGASVSGRVSLSPALAAQARPEDTVFILARPAEGSRMPLAVLRKQVKDLPLDFVLDDSMAMSPTATLSGQSQVVVVARVSRSGNAMPAPGDLTAQSAPVAPGAQGVTLQIADVVK